MSIPLALPIGVACGLAGAGVGFVLDLQRKKNAAKSYRAGEPPPPTAATRPKNKRPASAAEEQEQEEEEEVIDTQEATVPDAPPHIDANDPKELEGVTRRLRKYTNADNERYCEAFLRRAYRLVTLYNAVIAFSELKPPIVRHGDILTGARLLTRALEALTAFRQRIAGAWKEDADVVIDEFTQYLEAYTSLIRQTIQAASEERARNGPPPARSTKKK